MSPRRPGGKSTLPAGGRVHSYDARPPLTQPEPLRPATQEGHNRAADDKDGAD